MNILPSLIIASRLLLMKKRQRLPVGRNRKRSAAEELVAISLGKYGVKRKTRDGLHRVLDIACWKKGSNLLDQIALNLIERMGFSQAKCGRHHVVMYLPMIAQPPPGVQRLTDIGLAI